MYTFSQSCDGYVDDQKIMYRSTPSHHNTTHNDRDQSSSKCHAGKSTSGLLFHLPRDTAALRIDSLSLTPSPLRLRFFVDKVREGWEYSIFSISRV